MYDKVKVKQINYLSILWFLLCFGLIVLNKIEGLSMIVLYRIIPVCFIIVVLSELKIYFSNRSLMQYIYFSLWTLISLIFTVNFGMTINYFSVLLGNIILWYITFRIVMRSDNQIILLLIVFVSNLYHAIMGFFRPVEVTEVDYVTRVTGLFTNPNALGFAMWCGLITVIFLTTLRTKNTLIKILLWSCVPFFLLVMFQSGSRKNVFAVIIYLLVIVYYYAKTRYRWIIIAASILIFITSEFINISFLENTAFGSRISHEAFNSDIDKRSELIIEGLQMFQDHLIFGVGLGSYTYYSSTGAMSHNDYVEVLASTGIVGFLLYFPIYIIFFKQNRFLVKHEATFEWGVLSQAFLFGFMFLGLGRVSFLDPVAILIFAFYHSINLKKVQIIKSEELN